jgi:hypothetical protein
MKEQLMVGLMQMQNQFRVLHWQTKKYSRHQAYGGIYDALDDLIDSMVEVYMGKYGRVGFSGDSGAIELKNSSALDLNQFISSSINWLVGLTEQFDATMDTDLLNIRDEMVAEFNKLKYLLTLD